MTTLAWICLIIFLIILVSIIRVLYINDNSELTANMGILIALLFLFGMIVFVDTIYYRTVDAVNKEYIPKVVPTIKADSTWQFDTLYYIKVKPKSK